MLWWLSCNHSNNHYGVDLDMNNKKLLGIIVIILLILTIITSAYSSYIIHDDQNYTTNVLNAQNLETPVTTLNLNINQSYGGCSVKFVDSDNIYEINSSKSKDTSEHTSVTYTQNGDQLDVNIDSTSYENVILLSNRYKYNIKCKNMAGGYVFNISENANIDSLDTTLGIGGCEIQLEGGVLNNFHNQITVGGMVIEGEPNGLVNINSTIAIGGLQMQLNNPVYNINSTVTFGGVDVNHTDTDNENSTNLIYKDSNYDTSTNRVNLHSDIQIGGLAV